MNRSARTALMVPAAVVLMALSPVLVLGWFVWTGAKLLADKVFDEEV